MADIHCYFVSSQTKDDHRGRNVAMSLVLAKKIVDKTGLKSPR